MAVTKQRDKKSNKHTDKQKICLKPVLSKGALRHLFNQSLHIWQGWIMLHKLFSEHISSLSCTKNHNQHLLCTKRVQQQREGACQDFLFSQYLWLEEAIQGSFCTFYVLPRFLYPKISGEYTANGCIWPAITLDSAICVIFWYKFV